MFTKEISVFLGYSYFTFTYNFLEILNCTCWMLCNGFEDSHFSSWFPESLCVRWSFKRISIKSSHKSKFEVERRQRNSSEVITVFMFNKFIGCVNQERLTYFCSDSFKYLLFEFSDVLAENGRLKKLPNVVDAFKTLMSATRGEVLVEITSAKVNS